MASAQLDEQVVQAARIVVVDGLTQLEVRLDPPALGSIVVAGSAGPDGVGLTITAERPETHALLVQALPEIQALLTDRGIATTSVAVSPAFDPPAERRAPARRDADRGGRSHQPPTDSRRPAMARRRVGTVDLTV
jgi:hypothetical protein